MAVTLTAAAVDRVRQFMAGTPNALGLRFGVGGLLQARTDATFDYASTVPNHLSTADAGGHWGLPGGLSLCAILERADPRDALLSSGQRLAELPAGARGAPREQARQRRGDPARRRSGRTPAGGPAGPGTGRGAGTWEGP